MLGRWLPACGDQPQPVGRTRVSDDELITAVLAPYTGRTRPNIAYYLRWWRAWLADRGVGLLDATRGDVEAWIAHLVDARGLHPNTARSYLTGPAALYRWAVQEGLIGTDPMRYVRRPPDTRRTARPWLTRDEAVALLAAAEHADPATDAICHLLLLNGPRLGELLRVDVRDVATHGHLTTIRLHRVKTAASDLVSLAPPTERAVRRLVGDRRAGPLLVSEHTGQRMSDHTVRRLLRAALAAASLDTRIGPHDLRATFITLARQAGVPDVDVAVSAGIVTVSMLLRYDQMVTAVERNATHRLTGWLGSAPTPHTRG